MKKILVAAALLVAAIGIVSDRPITRELSCDPLSVLCGQPAGPIGVAR